VGGWVLRERCADERREATTVTLRQAQLVAALAERL
jgi:hypothetical protein